MWMSQSVFSVLAVNLTDLKITKSKRQNKKHFKANSMMLKIEQFGVEMTRFYWRYLLESRCITNALC